MTTPSEKYYNLKRYKLELLEALDVYEREKAAYAATLDQLYKEALIQSKEQRNTYVSFIKHHQRNLAYYKRTLKQVLHELITRATAP